MRNYADQDYLHARIHAMRGRLLSLSGYASMVREQAAASLKLTGAHDLIEAKEAVFQEQIAPVIALAGAYDKYAELFLAYLRQFETHNIKILLAKASGKESLEQWYDIGPFATLEKDLLKKNISLGEIKSLLANTWLAGAFKDSASYLRMEINLDIIAAQNLYRSSSLFSGEDKKEFQEMMLKRIAVLMVIWSHRLRTYYRWSDEQIRSYLEKITNMFGGQAQTQVRIVEEELTRHLEQLRKSGVLEPAVVDVERHLEQNYYAWVSAMFHRDFHSICCVVAYLWLLFYQIKNMLRMIDGRRFGFSAEAILDKMICGQ